jgi:hypothetical protein
MAKRPQFGSGQQAGQSVNDIILGTLRSQGIDTSSTTAVKAPRQPKAPRTTAFTQAEIAKDPTFSALTSGVTYEQALANYRKFVNANNLAPMADTTGKEYDKKMTAWKSAMAKLSPEQKNAEQVFFGLGGKLSGTGADAGVGYGKSDKQILNMWRLLGNEQMGMDIVSKRRGYDQYGNAIQGTPGLSANFTYGNDMSIKINNPLNQRQRQRLQRLRGMAPSSLSDKQRTALARLRTKKNAPQGMG